MRQFNTRKLSIMALLAALSIVLARLFSLIPAANARFSIEAVPVIVSGLLFGPIPGAIVGFVADSVGCLFNPYGYNPIFSVPPILYGLCAGLLRSICLKREKPSLISLILVILPAAVFGSVLWQSFWLSFFYGSATFLYYLGTRSIQFAVTTVLDAAIVYMLFRYNVFTSLRLWPPHRKDSEQK